MMSVTLGNDRSAPKRPTILMESSAFRTIKRLVSAVTRPFGKDRKKDATTRADDATTRADDSPGGAEATDESH